MKGVYALVISVGKSTRVKVGALGLMDFPRGQYVYVGSAQNNVEKRVSRHLRKRKKKFWHIDYLLGSRNTEVREVLVKRAGKEEECKAASVLAEQGTAFPMFGCSDCKCVSHLFKVSNSWLPGFKVMK